MLLGGYGGGWVTVPEALDVPLDEPLARKLGTSLGAGVVVLAPRRTCPLAETARIVRYLEQQNARQCGPCVNGLSELAQLCEALAGDPARLRRSLEPILSRCDLVEGRGACRHPDGAARLIRSALRVFSGEVDVHLRAGPCQRVATPSAMPGLGAMAVPNRQSGGRRRVPR